MIKWDKNNLKFNKTEWGEGNYMEKEEEEILKKTEFPF